MVWFISLLKFITLAGITYQNITNNLIIKPMEESINFAIWLKENCDNTYYNAYQYEYKLYYIDSISDMIELFAIFKQQTD